MGEGDDEIGVAREDAKRLFLLVCALVLAFLAGMVVSFWLQDPRWNRDLTRDEQILGDEREGFYGACSATAWGVLAAGSGAFRFNDVSASASGSYANAMSCEIHFDVILEGSSAGQAVVEVQTLEAFPRELPWGAPTSRACDRVFHASSDLFDRILAEAPALLPTGDSCLVMSDSLEQTTSATLWASRSYGKFRDYVEITLHDLNPELGDPSSRAQEFSEFFAGAVVEAAAAHLPP